MPPTPSPALVTGAAGFIGSHLVEELLRRGGPVIGLDDFSTGHRSNLAAVRAAVGEEAWRRFRLVEGDVRDSAVCAEACSGVEVIFHQAALSSVPLSMDQPARVLSVNVDGFVQILDVARRAGVRRVVFASSSAVYGDDITVPAREDRIGRPLSPYGASKALAEQVAAVFSSCFGLETVGLRYFNVVGTRQDPAGPYAAVVPRWFRELREGRRPTIFGDGETTRDFCPVADVVAANLLAASSAEAAGRVLNVARGQATTLNQLFLLIRRVLAAEGVDCAQVEPRHADFRPGDVRHSRADVRAAREILGFVPSADIEPVLRRIAAEESGSAGRPKGC
ncbi:MAG: NAD-dependent epimerase/dehydratase family protein [Planctomycetota bacterium]|nr:MAG: NAD-dependent epimerase/dehydratase family protein [Planctomycetota bacterium]